MTIFYIANPSEYLNLTTTLLLISSGIKIKCDPKGMSHNEMSIQNQQYILNLLFAASTISYCIYVYSKG